MKFLVDENLPLSLAHWLVDRGHEADHTSVLGLNATPDRDLVGQALRVGAAIVTKDADFLTISTTNETLRVVHVRVGNRSSRELLALCERVWPDVVAAFEGGERVVQVEGLR